VLRVVPEESRLFLTKERAPFLVCLEVYRPEELKIADDIKKYAGSDAEDLN
jgi:hypothetical protein